jgi:hypothetical protein
MPCLTTIPPAAAGFQLAIGQEPRVGGDLAAMEFELQAPVEISAQVRFSGVTRQAT